MQQKTKNRRMSIILRRQVDSDFDELRISLSSHACMNYNHWQSPKKRNKIRFLKHYSMDRYLQQLILIYYPLIASKGQILINHLENFCNYFQLPMINFKLKCTKSLRVKRSSMTHWIATYEGHNFKWSIFF